MSKQYTLIALDWLMPVLQDVFDELAGFLSENDENKNWNAIQYSLHQITGALTLTRHQLLAHLSKTLESICQAIDVGDLSIQHQVDVAQGIVLLRYEIQQLQQNQQLHVSWLLARINYLKDILGEVALEPDHLDDNLVKIDGQYSLLAQLPLPETEHEVNAEGVQDLLKLWRYYTEQLLDKNQNQAEFLTNLAQVSQYLANSQLKVSYRQVWKLVATWVNSQILNEIPMPHHYAYLLKHLDGLMSDDEIGDLSDLKIASVAVDVLFELSQLVNQSDDASQYLNTPIISPLQKGIELQTLFEKVLVKLEKTIYQVNEPSKILPILAHIKQLLENRGWILYQNQLEQIIADVDMIVADPKLWNTVGWQVERQLQDLYSQLLETSDTIESKIGLVNFSYDNNPKQEALRQTRVNLENIKLAFNNYIQTHQIDVLQVSDDLLAMIHVFGLLELNQPKELTEQLRLLFGKLTKQSVTVLPWELTDTIAEMIAQFELFLDYLSHQNVNHELLEQTQSQLNKVNMLVARLLDNPIEQKDLPSRHKVFSHNTLVYDDEGEKLFSTGQVVGNHHNIDKSDGQELLTDLSDTDEPLFADEGDVMNSSNVADEVIALTDNTDHVALPILQETPALLEARTSLKEDDFSVDEDIREIFIEEADEVLQQMDENLPIWQADATDLMTLKEIRRGFHTLKGSGRMVGANQVGETAWAVENMLNRVLDGTLSITPELVQFIVETRQFIPTLVDDFKQKQSPSLDPAVVVLKAHNLLKQQPINQGLEYLNAVAAVVTQTENSESIVEDVDDIETLFSDDVVDDNRQTDVVAPVIVETQAMKNTVPFNDGDLPVVVQQEIDQLNWEKDEVLDADIQEIYVEEAQEVLETITPLYRSWQHHTNDDNTLKEIRRGFHTLKGSGRMVGAKQLGELAWAIENMLNRVLDHTIAVNEGLVTLVGDVLKVFPSLVQTFAQNRDDYPEKMMLWAGVAHAYSKKHGDAFDYQTLRDWQSQADFITSVNVVADDMALVADDVGETVVASDESLENTTIAPVVDDLIDDESNNGLIADDDIIDETDDVIFDDDPEQTAIGRAFIEESQELLEKIERFVQSHRGDQQVYISDELVRAFHTLRGGAALSELPRVYALSEALEDSLAQLLRKEIPLTAEQLELLSGAQQDLAQYIRDYQTHQSVVETSSDVGSIDHLTKQLLGNLDINDKRPLTVSQLMALDIDDLLDADRNLPVEFAHEHEDIVDYATKLQVQAQRLAQETQGLKFASVAETLDMAYRQLKIYPSFGKDEEYVNALLNVHYQLIDVFDTIAAGLNIRIDDNVLSQLKQVAEAKEFEAKMAAIEYEMVDTDVELLEIFLEEATALDSDIHKHFHQWYNNLTNLDAVKSLQRYLHTIKGGANMVGIASISSLALSAEKLYAAIAKEEIPSTPELAMVMQKVQETLTTQLQLVKVENRSFFAKEFESQLEKIYEIHDADELQLFRDTVWAVPLIVEIYQNEQNLAESTTETGKEEHANDIVYTQEIINNFEQRRLETWHGQEPDADILSVFLEEAKELVDSSSQHLQEFRSNTNNISSLQALQRELHTIKGGARMVGAEGLATLSHEMETVYEELGSRRKPATRMIGNLLAACHDWLASALYVLENKFNPQTPNPLILSLQEFSKNPDSLKTIPLTSLASQIEQIDIYNSSILANQAEQKERDLSVMPAMTGNFEEVQEQASLNTEMVRIPANLMERMINLSGESAINRARIEMGVSGLINTIEEMGTTVQRLADQLRRMETELEVQILAQIGDEHLYDVEFDPLEMDQYSSLNQLSKSLSESASDLLDIKATMLDKTRDTENLLLQLSRTQTELQEGLMNSRTVPFSRITPRLQRIARQTATELGKSVELRILNDDDEIDRNILDRITSPLEHMLRNAVDHGVEKSQERIEAGKPRTGLITLELLREGGEIVLHLSDDGKGINVDAVRKKAIDQGLISANDTSLKPLDIMQYIFNAGLSTSTSVTQISGRGVGMDVVQSEVKQLGGVVTVDSEMGKGSRFTMRLPLTVAVSDALMVRAGDKNFAVPLVQIERVVRISAEDIYAFHTSDKNTIEIDGDDYRLRYLNQMLYGSDPLDSLRQQSASVPVIIVRNEAGQKLALQVDALAGSRIEVVVKPLGRQLSHISGISAATIMGDGSVMLILDLIALMRNAATVVRKERIVQTPKVDRKTVVMIIDDSVTVRKVTSRLLERHGYETHVATDGVDALEKLQEMTPDIMLLDIEMPRMDGFEVANQVRHTSRLKDVPIIMITSRTGEKHRERAMNIGVNEYMGKPFQEQQLLESITNLTAHRLT